MTTFDHSFSFDPSYGYTEDALLNLRVPEEVPGDFERFWRELYREAMQVRPAACFEEPQDHGDWRIELVGYQSIGGRSIGGWLTLPAHGEVKRLVVAGSGYGGRAESDVRPIMENAACLFFCARGLPERSLQEDLPSSGAFHVLAGIENRSTYIHGGCCADLWLAASVLRERFGNDLPLHYWGGSFGGGIGALALPWDDRFTSACLIVPSFGNHPLRLGLQCTGSGEAVRLLHRKKPKLVETLRYFDAATAARFLKLPTIYVCARFDPAVPPPGQFSVWRAHAGPQELFILSAGHFEHPGLAEETKAYEERARRFFRLSET